jgi:alginate O-acetyltransferase complex protein AlgI
MAFNSVTFLFVFLPFILVLHRTAPAALRNGVLLVASIFFYAFAEPIFVFVIAGTCLSDWLLGRAMVVWPTAAVRRLCLAGSIASNLGVLLWVKYANFAAANLNELLAPHGVSLAVVSATLPIGVSFITFEKISYVVDIYRGVSRPAASWRDYFLFIFLFPKLMAGPIVKYHEIADQLAKPHHSPAARAQGLARFVVGLAKKVLIADTMAESSSAIFGAPLDQLGFTTAWLGAICFSVQIFFDFSGYSDMAIGLAAVFGFQLRENFEQPYRARDFTEFWRRWHISLSTWIRDYLYIPLGGSRISPGRTYANLLLCFLASGLWHGASWTFVVWGLYHGSFIMLDRLSAHVVRLRLPAAFGAGLTFLLVTLGWVLFRSPSFGQAFGMLGVMFDPAARTSPALAPFGSDVYLFLILGLLLGFMPNDPLRRLADIAGQASAASIRLKGTGLALLLIIACGRAMTATFNPFLYFRF